jgi:hypothetical protein
MKYILAVLLAAILLFGCSAPGGGTQTGTGTHATTGGTSGGTGGTGTGGTGGTTGGTGATGTGGTTGGTGATGGTGGTSGTGGALDLSSWSMETLAGMGTPVHCTVTYTDQDVNGNYDMYIIGDSFMVTGQSTVEGGTQQFTEVVKTVSGKKMLYIQFSNAQGAMMQGCDWMSFEVNESQTEPTAQTTTLNVDQSPTNFQCFPAVFGQEKFATPGRVCDYSSLISNPSSICDQYTGDMRDQCLASMG